MSARRQRQADADQRRKELVEQLELQKDRGKKAGDQVCEFWEVAAEILNEAAEDEMVEKLVDEIVEVAAEADTEPFSFQSIPANEDAVIFDPKSRKLTEEEIKEVAGDVESLLVGELPEFSDTIIDMPVAGEPELRKSRSEDKTAADFPECE